ncbi:MAG: hypothetical protein DSZ07_06140 [Sulfurovum sp.]|nr:MAG: hypothetical protein DSZ07_06140 [Sulfurovum sp.]
MKHLFIFFILIHSSFLWAEEEASYGWNIPNSSINIGGYLDTTYDTKREEKFLFNDIALIFSANKEHFNLLGEVELSHISLNGKSNNRSDIDLNVERLQLNYTLNDKQSIQIGRFNSDIGYWNQAPIPILQDTTTTPHIVGNFFPKATTGVLFRQNINEENSFSITFQDNKDIAHQDKAIQVNRHQALAYYGTHNDFSWRFSLGSYRENRNKKARYIGIGSEYDGEEFSIQTELFKQHSDKDDEKPYSGYIQSTWHFKEKQDATFRFESYEDNALDIKEEIYLLGYSYRPTKNTALKGEYIHHTKLPLNHFVYSFSVLF